MHDLVNMTHDRLFSVRDHAHHVTVGVMTGGASIALPDGYGIFEKVVMGVVVALVTSSVHALAQLLWRWVRQKMHPNEVLEPHWSSKPPPIATLPAPVVPVVLPPPPAPSAPALPHPRRKYPSNGPKDPSPKA